MEIENNISIGMLSKHFSIEEFQCRCGCGTCYVNEYLIYKLEYARDELKRPINITSGCRCPLHNKASGGNPNSTHISVAERMLCEGADILIPSNHYRALIVPILSQYFQRIGFGDNFIHVDIRNSYPSPRYWMYSGKRKKR